MAAGKSERSDLQDEVPFGFTFSSSDGPGHFDDGPSGWFKTNARLETRQVYFKKWMPFIKFMEVHSAGNKPGIGIRETH